MKAVYDHNEWILVFDSEEEVRVGKDVLEDLIADRIYENKCQQALRGGIRNEDTEISR